MSARPSQRRRRAPLARYVNYFEVGHNAFEFLIDFGQFHPDAGDVQMHSRMVTGPVHVKLLALVLQEAIARFEAEHGAIADLKDDDNPLESLLIPLPDFERRAVAARGDAESRPTPARQER